MNKQLSFFSKTSLFEDEKTSTLDEQNESCYRYVCESIGTFVPNINIELFSDKKSHNFLVYLSRHKIEFQLCTSNLS